MKQQLWVLNSSLVLILIVALGISLATFVRVPKNEILHIAPTEEISKPDTSHRNVQKIYLNDLFDTYIAQTEAAVPQPINALPTVPPLPASVTPHMPQEIPTETLPPLAVKVRGIILASDRLQSVALIEDETGKEMRYHVGGKVKDAQIIKVTPDRVIMLRANGQQDILYLRKGDAAKPNNAWLNCIKKISKTQYHVDIARVKREIGSLGTLLEELSLITVFENGLPVGLHVGIQDQNSIGIALGLLENDLLVALNNFSLSSPDDRLKAFDTLSAAPYGSTLSLEVRRSGAPLTIRYEIVYISQLPLEKKVSESLFDVPLQEAQKSNLQKRQQEFEGTMEHMRSRLLENVRLGRPKVRSVM